MTKNRSQLSTEYGDGNFIIQLIKRYVNNYRGIPLSGWQCIFMTLVNDMATGIVFFLSLYFVGILHFSIAKASIIISCYGIGKAIGGIVGGKLTDMMSADTIIISCLLIEAFLYLTLIKIHAFPILVIIGFILGVSAYIFTTANKLFVLNSINDHEDIKLKVLSLFYTASNFGLGMTAIYVAWLSKYGFNYIFSTSSVLLAASAILMYYQRRKKPVINLNNSQYSTPQQNTLNKGQNIVVAWLVLACLFSIGLIIAQLGTTYPVFLTQTFPYLGVNAVSFIFILNTMLILFLQTPFANYFNKSNKILMVGIGAFLMAGAMALLSDAYSFLIVIISMVIYTMGEMIFFCMAQLVIYQHSSQDKKGQGMGLFQTTFALSMVIGPTIGGYVYDNFGCQILWCSCGLIGTFWLLISAYIKKYDIIEQN